MLDVLMPGMDGWSVLESLKGDPATRDIPVIMVTMTDDRDLGFALGATEFLTKPIDRGHLVNLLDRYAASVEDRDVLVVDDSAEVRDVVRRALEREGWSVREASNGREAFEQLQAKVPSLVLLDLMMPVMDGYEVYHLLKEDPRTKNIPVIIITAKGERKDRQLGMSSATYQYVVKPFTVDEVLGKARDVLQQRTVS